MDLHAQCTILQARRSGNRKRAMNDFPEVSFSRDVALSSAGEALGVLILGSCPCLLTILAGSTESRRIAMAGSGSCSADEVGTGIRGNER